MNLRDEFLPWKTLIGQIILDKNRNITSVVNKLDVIDSTFRNFRMEVLAGEDNMIAEVRESGCRFKFDFSQVYWNSRLHTEHDRLVKMFKKGDYVADVFAGVGPFALPASKKGCIVYANDLNPASYKYLQENVTLNKIKTGIYAYNLDGRDFIRKAVEDLDATVISAPVSTPATYRTFDHFVMNLPAIALEFLDAFRGLYRAREPHFRQTPAPVLPMIHCHCFSKSETPEQDVIERAGEAMGHSINPASCTVHHVRKVAPNKDMFCLSFRLSEEVAFGRCAVFRIPETGSSSTVFALCSTDVTRACPPSAKRKDADPNGGETVQGANGVGKVDETEGPASKKVRVEDGSG
ncbi:Met-10+ like-protein-domain-containing protein [Jimgerdemannia flammicorona]|uniref:tRNA (guanine(37)-N1)-methyltransferase n=1 Tax=Jimgerdemannia flammicorona TaxID=994334 RepID=A0A433PDU3_9FUNG|nr:Met-10+ like-protein-domain-containing protein [Jimgerdemannia flammicorona]